MVADACPEDFEQVIVRLGYLYRIDLQKQLIQMMARTVSSAGWTLAELDIAEALMCTDKQLSQRIHYAQTVEPSVFALAKDRLEVRKGRLFSHEEAIDYCKHHYQPKGEETEWSGVSNLFEVVFVEDDLHEKGTLKPYWRLR